MGDADSFQGAAKEPMADSDVQLWAQRPSGLSYKERQMEMEFPIQ